MFGKLPIAVLHHDDSRIHKDADGERQSAERHNVRADVEVVHRDEGRQHGNGQGKDGNQRRAKVEQEEDDDDADDDGLFEQVALQGLNGGRNQAGAVVAGDDFDTGRQGRFGLRQFFLYAIDDGQSIHPIAHDDDACDGLPFALPLGDAFANVRPEADRTQIPHKDWCSVLRGDRYRLQVAQGAQIPEPTDHVLRAADYEQATADFICAGAHFLNHRRKGNAIRAQLGWIDIDLVLLDESADCCDFRYTGNGFELIAQVPVLNAAQFRETALVAAVDKDVLVDPACAGRVGADDRMNSGWQPPGDLLHVFEDARARPIEIRSIFENDEYVGIPEHGLRPHRLDVRGGEKFRDDGIRDLVLDKTGGLSGPRCMDDDLNVRDVRQRVQRNAAKRPDSREHEQQRSREHQKTVLRTPINPTRDHVTFLPWRSR